MCQKRLQNHDIGAIDAVWNSVIAHDENLRGTLCAFFTGHEIFVNCATRPGIHDEIAISSRPKSHNYSPRLQRKANIVVSSFRHG